MKFQPNPENGKLDLIVEFSPAVECADIWPQDLQGMKDRAKRYMGSGDKIQRRLARDLSKAILWIEREIYALQTSEAK
jgi:hypothetical protein